MGRITLIGTSAAITLVAVAGAGSAARSHAIVFMRQTLVAQGRGDVSCQALYSVEPDGSNLRRVMGCGKTGKRIWSSSPSWSPSGKKIAFARCDLRPSMDAPGCYELYVMNADGSHVRRLTKNRVYDDHPSWSPDGRRIVFTRGSGNGPEQGGADLWLINADGTHARPLIRDTPFEGNPVWSQSGGLIAFYQYKRRAVIGLIRPDGTGRRTLAPSPYGGGAFDTLMLQQPTWSPDGRRLAFTSSRGRVELVTVGGRVIREYPPNPSGRASFHLSWSPEGRSIVYAQWRDDSPSGSLYRLTLSSGAVSPLTASTFPADDEQPDW